MASNTLAMAEDSCTRRPCMYGNPSTSTVLTVCICDSTLPALLTAPSRTRHLGDDFGQDHCDRDEQAALCLPASPSIMVNASSTTAAVYRLQAWPQRANHGKSHQRVPCACKSTPTPRSAGGGAVNIRRLRCSAAIPNSTTGSVLTCSNSRQTSHKGSGPSHACTSRLPINLAALLLKVSCRLIETLATVSLLTHPLPAMAGEIIQGSPRVSDGDTIQVVPPTRVHSFCIRRPGSTHRLIGGCGPYR